MRDVGGLLHQIKIEANMKTTLNEVRRMQQLAGIRVNDFVATADINMQRVITESVVKGNPRSFNAAMMYHVVPKVINEVKKDILRSLHTNDYFTVEERYVLCEYFNMHKTFLHESRYVNNLDEGLKDWWKSGKEKLKDVFGSVKEYISKIWEKVKEVFAKMIEKGKTLVKPAVEKMKGKAKAAVDKIKTDPELKEELVAETIALGEMTGYAVGKGVKKITSALDKLEDDAAKKVEAGEDLGAGEKETGEKSAEKSDGQLSELVLERKSLIKENFVFNYASTLHILENTKNTRFLTEEEAESKEGSEDATKNPADEKKSSWPTFLTKKGWKDNWKKYLFNIFKVILNPVMGGIGVVGGYVTEVGLNWLSKVIAKLGGPPAKKFHVIPEYIFAGMEIKGMYNSMFETFLEASKPFLELIPFGIGSAFIKLWEFGHYALLIYAIYEVLKETLDTLGLTKHVKQFAKDMAAGQSKVAGA